MTATSAHTGKILLALGTPGLLSSYGKRLRQEGYGVLVATNGKQALAIAQTKCPQLIIAETGLAVLNGFELCRAARENSQGLTAKVILVSESNEYPAKYTMPAYRADDFILSSCEPGELLERIHFVLGKTGKSKRGKGRTVDNTPKKLLLVEDNELNQGFISALLKDAGFEIDVADNGGTALENFLTRKYDLVLTDINVPVINGLELTRIIRSKYSQTIPIIAISGQTEQEMIDKCLTAGIYKFMVKPFTGSELKEAVKKALSKHQTAKGDTNPTIESEIKAEGKTYNYSNASEMAKGDEALLIKWINRFNETLKSAKLMVDNAIENDVYPPRHLLFHELLNYSTYFGLEELSSFIHELNSIQRISGDTERLANFYKKIKNELEDIIFFYQNIG